MKWAWLWQPARPLDDTYIPPIYRLARWLGLKPGDFS